MAPPRSIGRDTDRLVVAVLRQPRQTWPLRMVVGSSAAPLSASFIRAGRVTEMLECNHTWEGTFRAHLNVHTGLVLHGYKQARARRCFDCALVRAQERDRP